MQFLEFFYLISFPAVRPKLVSKAFGLWNRLISGAAKKLYPSHCEKRKNTVGVCNTNYNDFEVVISLTSFPSRMNTIKWTLESLCRQSMKPNRIELWLCSDEFGNENIPDELTEFVSRGIEVKFTDINLKPHNKSFHSARENPNRLIITVDDDVLYSERLVEKLYAEYLKSDKHTVICEHAHRITFDRMGRVKMYNQWDWDSKGIQGPSMLLMPKGVGGVLYPLGFFGELYFDLDTINRCCLSNDDLWLKVNGYNSAHFGSLGRNYRGCHFDIVLY